MSLLTIDLDNNPDLHFRIDNFTVPDEAREEFEDAMRRNLTFLQGLPGFRGHVAFEKTGGPTRFNLVTSAVWESKQALDKAGEQVRAYYKTLGFDMPAMLARWGSGPSSATSTLSVECRNTASPTPEDGNGGWR